MQNVFSQNKKITGEVKDSSGNPLPGVSILVKGTTRGVDTDFDGNYSISDVSASNELVFSYLGMISQTIAVGNNSQIDVVLLDDATSLDEVIVMGYSSQTRGDLTGSVASIDMDEALKAPVVTAAEALQGRSTGVTVISNNTPGSAPKINIRGFGTTNNTNPLFIIDGVQTDDPNALNNLNPSDIDQMNVLKDGAAAIYGARAANGVVIITTKGGGYNQSKPTVTLDMYTGFSQIANTVDMLNPEQHAQMLFQSQVNDGVSPSHPQYGDGTFTVPSSIVRYNRVKSYKPITLFGEGEKSAAVTPGGTDWIDAMTASALTNNIALSLSNGNETGKYFMSLGYLTRDGVAAYTGFERLSTRLNSEFKIGDKITIGEHMNVSFTNTQSGNSEAWEMALRMTPLLPVYDDEGLFAGSRAPGIGNTRNPVAQNYRTRDDYAKRYAAFGDVYLNWEIIENLSFKTTLGGGFNTFDSRRFTSLDPEHGEPIGINNLNEQDQTASNWIWSNVLSYNKTYKEHSINALLGYEALKNSDKGKGVTVSDFLFETPDFYLLNNGAVPPKVDYAYDNSNSLASVFATVNYSFRDKYYATVTLRNDTSSRFLGDNKSATFPSFSGGWIMSKEDFFNADGFVNRLKLKGSWGQLGNQTLPVNNPTINISSLNSSQADYYFDGANISSGAIISAIGNPNLKWETSETLNFGVELAMLDSRLNMSVEGYQIKTKDLISQDFGLISTTAIDASAPYVNLGDIQNTGFDLGIGWNDTTDSGFSYGASLNLSRYKNEVVKLIGGAPVGGRTNELRGQQPTRTEEGEEMSYFYGRKVIGLSDTGRFVYEDVNGDGTVDDDDRTNIGSPHADFTYGLNLSGAYKGFDAQLFFTGSQGNDIYNFNKFYTDFPAFVNGNRSTRVLNAWTPSNTNTTVPALSTSITNNEGDPNSYYVEDGSFFRLKNIQIGYSLSENITSKMNISSARFYLQATNLFTITDYSGFDPEIISQNNLSLGVDNRIYPNSKIFTMGVNFKF